MRSTRGPAGGYRLDRGYRTRLTGVGLDEAGALGAEARRALEDEAAAVEVSIRVAPRALPRLRRLVPVPGKDRVPVTATGEVELIVPFENVGWAVSALLSLGSAVEVLASDDMRERVAEELRAAVDRYADT